LDYALLSPVFPTPSHPEAKGLGWDKFVEEITNTTIPVFALGGMKNELLATAQSHGAHGIALMRGW
jgi:8-oxo-dGTP diphosphatase